MDLPLLPVMEIRSWSLCVVLILLVDHGHTITLESILWSSSNTEFTPGQGLILYPQIGDKMDIVCPRSDTSSRGTEEFYRVYLVSRRQTESCVIDKMDTPLLSCDKPDRDVKFTFKFQEFSPNLWGFEFLKGRDYYITSTSTGSLRGLHNTDGGVCRTKSMRLVLRVGQNASDLSTLQESPTRFPPTRPKSKAKDNIVKEHDLKGKTDIGTDAEQTTPSDAVSDTQPLWLWIFCGCLVTALIIIISLVLLWRRHRPLCVPQSQRSASVSLNAVAVPKRDSISSDNNGSDHSDTVFPLGPSDSIICHHYERVSSDYAAPMYIVQEIAPATTPTNIYYRV